MYIAASTRESPRLGTGRATESVKCEGGLGHPCSSRTSCGDREARGSRSNSIARALSRPATRTERVMPHPLASDAQRSGPDAHIVPK